MLDRTILTLLVTLPLVALFVVFSVREYRWRVRGEGQPVRLDLGTFLVSVVLSAVTLMLVYMRPQWIVPYGVIVYSIVLLGLIVWAVVDWRRRRR